MAAPVPFDDLPDNLRGQVVPAEDVPLSALQQLQSAKREMPAAFARQATGVDRLAPLFQPGDLSRTLREMGSEYTMAEQPALGLLAGGQRVAEGAMSMLPGARSLAKKLGYEGDIGATEQVLQGAGPIAKGSELVGSGIATAMPARAAALGVGSLLPQASRLGTAMRSAPGIAATEGAIGGAMVSPEDPAMGAVMGAPLGFGAQQVGSRLGRTIAQPIPQTAEAAAARAQGIPLTAGLGADQTTLRGRVANAGERVLSGTPLLGGPISRRRAEAVSAWRRNVLGETLPAGVSRETITPGAPIARQFEEASAAQNAAYRSALNDVDPVSGQYIPRPIRQGVDSEWLGDIGGITARHRSYGLNVDEAKAVEDYAMSQLIGKVHPGTTTEDVFKTASDLRSTANRWARSSNEITQAKGEMLKRIVDTSYDFLDRAYPGTAQKLFELKIPQAKFKAVEKAGGGINQEFTPRRLFAASKHPEMQSMAREGENLLGEVRPGAHRMTMPGLGAFAGVSGAGFVDPVIGSLLAGSALGYGTKMAQKALSGQYWFQKGLAELLKKPPATSGAAGGVTAGELVRRLKEEER